MFGIEEMARIGCTTPRGIRFWEEKGLLGAVERTAGDTRRFTKEQADKARIIAAAQFGGWTLDEIATMLDEWGPEAHVAIVTRLSEQAMAASRLATGLPEPTAAGAPTVAYDL